MSNSNLLDEAFRCVEAIGYDKTIDALKKAQFYEVKFEDKVVERVVEIVSKKTNVPVFEILHGNGRKNERKYAIGFCAHYLHSTEFYGYEMEDVKNQLNKDSTITCYKYAKMITRLNPNHTADKDWCEIRKELDITFRKTPARTAAKK